MNKKGRNGTSSLNGNDRDTLYPWVYFGISRIAGHDYCSAVGQIIAAIIVRQRGGAECSRDSRDCNGGC